MFLCMVSRGHQFFRSQWEGPQIDAWARRVEPRSMSSLGAREHLPIEARKNGLFYAMILDIFYVLLPETIFCITT